MERSGSWDLAGCSELLRSYLYLRYIRTTSNGVFKVRYTPSRKKNIPRSKNQEEPHHSRIPAVKELVTGDGAPEVDPSWVSTLVVPVGFSPSALVLVLDLALPRSSAFFKASVRPVPPIPYWSRTSALAGAGDSKSRSAPVPVFGKAITSRIDGVLHSMDISLSNPVYRIAFGLRFGIVRMRRVFARFLEGSTKRTHEVFASAESWVQSHRSAGEIGKHEKNFSQQRMFSSAGRERRGRRIRKKEVQGFRSAGHA